MIEFIKSVGNGSSLAISGYLVGERSACERTRRMINNVVLVGRMTRDAELRYTPQNQAVATFTLAVNRNFKISGERSGPYQCCYLASAGRKPC